MRPRPTTVTPLLAAALITTACGGADRHFTELSVSAQGILPSAENRAGWSVELTRAEIHLETLRVFEGETLATHVAREAWQLVAGGGVAFAHPGHYESGAAIAEWREPAVVDLLSADPVELGRASGITGRYGIAELAFGPCPELDGAVVHLEGTAVRGDERVPFTADVVASFDILGLDVDGIVHGHGAQLVLQIDVAAWLDQVDFALDPAVMPDGPTHNALTRGVSRHDAYRVNVYSEPTP